MFTIPSPSSHRLPILAALAVVPLLLLGASACAATPPATLSASPPATLTQPLAVPSPATATPESLPTTPTASVTLSPEIHATHAEDVVGRWLMHVRGLSGLVEFDAVFELRNDGSCSIDDTSSAMHIEAGTFTFRDGQLVLDSDECYNTTTGAFFHCIGIFTVYVVKQEDTPRLLRFVEVDDHEGGDRVRNLRNHTLRLAAG